MVLLSLHGLNPIMYYLQALKLMRPYKRYSIVHLIDHNVNIQKETLTILFDTQRGNVKEFSVVCESI